MKLLKKLLIIIPASVLGIFILLLVTPVLFKGKILEIAKKELNKMLEARVDFSDVRLSFIRNFPDAYVGLEDLKVTGTGEFEGETLVEFKSLGVTANIISVIKMNNIRVRSVLLDRARINARISENGNANWNIMKPQDAPPDETPPAGDKTAGKEKPPSPLKITLNKFEIRDAGLSFRDDSRKMEASADGLDFLLSGDMTLDNADLDMKLDIAGVNFKTNGVNLLTKARVGLVSQIAADLKNMEFTLKDNRFNLNEIVLKFAGSLRMPGDIDIDMTFAAERTDFKSVLGLIPAIYMKDFESVTTEGSFALSGGIKGPYNDQRMPDANVNLSIINAMFKYPDLPKSVNNINVKAAAFYDGAVFDRTTLDVDKLHFEMAGNPFDAELHVKTPQSDMRAAAKFAGRIDFGSVAGIVPLDDITLKGLLECDFALAGKMSDLENKRYEDFDARGMLKLSGVDFKSPDFPQAVKISDMRLNLTPKRAELANFDAVIGNSDIALNGMLENFIPYVFKGSTVSGNLSLKSNNIDLNELMAKKDPAGTPAEKQAERPAESDTPLSVIEVPKNIDFLANVKIGRLLFGKLNITDTAGAVSVKDGKLRMRNLSMNMLEGTVRLAGEYDTADIKVPRINFDADIGKVDVASALSSFDILGKILPNPQNYSGKVSANIALSSVLDERLKPVLDTVASKGGLMTHNVKIQNSELFGAMAGLLKNEAWRTPALNDINIRYEIKEGRLSIEPVRINVAQTALELSGSQGLDMTLAYKVGASVPVSAVGSAATDILGKIPGGSNIKEIKVAGLIGGTVTKPAVTLNVADTAGTAAGAVAEGVKETVKQQAKEEIDKQIAAITAEAEKQAQTVRNTAKQAAEKIRNEAEAAANKLESEAESKPAIQKTLAKAAANKLRDEGNANAAKVEQEAEKQVAAITDAARKKAGELRNN